MSTAPTWKGAMPPNICHRQRFGGPESIWGPLEEHEFGLFPANGVWDLPPLVVEISDDDFYDYEDEHEEEGGSEDDSEDEAPWLQEPPRPAQQGANREGEEGDGRGFFRVLIMPQGRIDDPLRLPPWGLAPHPARPEVRVEVNRDPPPRLLQPVNPLRPVTLHHEPLRLYFRHGVQVGLGRPPVLMPQRGLVGQLLGIEDDLPDLVTVSDTDSSDSEYYTRRGRGPYGRRDGGGNTEGYGAGQAGDGCSEDDGPPPLVSVSDQSDYSDSEVNDVAFYVSRRGLRDAMPALLNEV
eukprot:comp22550_c0_seq3/m.34300 comp22550_c0_seq3/g.34300  ORF comp22550_c0_seq3/g.34300 comp22550_c0_seq3/m.34300 type:complete len:294 (-) comp22550_c0_seq3:59-940(-)